MPSSAALTGPEITALTERLSPALVLAGADMTRPGGGWPVLEAAGLRAMMAGPAAADWHLGHPDRPAYIVATSGTSGRPSLVIHAHRSILARTLMRDGWHGMTAADRVMHAGALGWTYTLGAGYLDPWAAGATAVMPLAGLEQLPLLAKRHNVTILAAVPGVYRRLLRAGLPPLPGLRYGLSAGEALPPALRADWHEVTGTDLHEALGMSEINTWVSGSPSRPAPQDRTGWPQHGRRVAVLGDDRLPVPRGEVGVLAVSRDDPGLALGYLDEPEGWQARLAGEWFLSGDLGIMDAAGAVRMLGRTDDLMNAGGHRVSPVEVEAAFTAVSGLSGLAAGEVEVSPGVRVIGALYVGEAEESALAAHAAAQLARWKQPRLWRRAEALPLTRMGKLDRRAVAALLAGRP